MARTWVFLFMLLLVLFTSSTNGRKLLNTPPPAKNEEPTLAMKMSLYLNVLPKGTVPASTPSKRGHSAITDEKLITRHLIAVDRILRSVPSPGVGH
ncbi:hypothetical protein SSX86_030255 [Deinandra increscens subsp. villosa]|uniref:Uncharacterized protein n=1 Tax=Deinandra increscens subsp. villosa TaxID=3103831 RepID=A0AAP0GJU7_9ASTR